MNHRSNPSRRDSAHVTRPKAGERVRSSSSSLARTLSPQDVSSSRPSRAPRASFNTNRSSRSHRDSVTADTRTFELSDNDGVSSEHLEEWENGISVKGERKVKSKRDEPMSPIAVVCYVVFFYIIWQILTRSDETEILGHLPLSHLQSLSSSLHSDLRPQAQSQYHLPYHLPQIPSPIPNTPAESTSTSRTFLGIIFYPFYLLLTLVATPLPLLLNTLYLIVNVLITVLYPITATVRLLGQTFVLAPLGIISNVLSVFYPLYVFIAGVIGVGCVLGLGVGWVGKLFLDLLFGKRRRTMGHGRQSRTLSTRARSAIPSTASHDPKRKATYPSSGEDREYIRTPHERSRQSIQEEDDEFQMMPERLIDRKGAGERLKSGMYKGTDAPVVGLRKRGARSFMSAR